MKLISVEICLISSLNISLFVLNDVVKGRVSLFSVYLELGLIDSQWRVRGCRLSLLLSRWGQLRVSTPHISPLPPMSSDP